MPLPSPGVAPLLTRRALRSLPQRTATPHEKEAYKEKSRKCQAWEKAYGHLRAQVTGREDDESGRSKVVESRGVLDHDTQTMTLTPNGADLRRGMGNNSAARW